MPLPAIFRTLFTKDADGSLRLRGSRFALASEREPGAGLVASTPNTASQDTAFVAAGSTLLRSTPLQGLVALKTDADGMISSDFVARATGAAFGVVKLSADFEEAGGAADGVALSVPGAKALYARLANLQAYSTVIGASRTFVAPETATYTVMCVGGGGNGGADGASATLHCQHTGGGPDATWTFPGGAGGTGGAGQVVTKDISLTKGASIAVVVGGPGGTTKFGELVTALGGGHGGAGGNAWASTTPQPYSATVPCGGPGSPLGAPGTAGAAGVSYGSGPTPLHQNGMDGYGGGPGAQGTRGVVTIAIRLGT